MVAFNKEYGPSPGTAKFCVDRIKNKKVEGAEEDWPAHGQEEVEGYCV